MGNSEMEKRDAHVRLIGLAEEMIRAERNWSQANEQEDSVANLAKDLVHLNLTSDEFNSAYVDFTNRYPQGDK